MSVEEKKRQREKLLSETSRERAFQGRSCSAVLWQFGSSDLHVPLLAEDCSQGHWKLGHEFLSADRSTTSKTVELHSMNVEMWQNLGKLHGAETDLQHLSLRAGWGCQANELVFVGVQAKTI